MEIGSTDGLPKKSIASACSADFRKAKTYLRDETIQRGEGYQERLL